MANATEKQIAAIRKMGYNVSDDLPKEQVQYYFDKGPVKKAERESQPKSYQSKPFNASTMYVSYAKDICVAMLNNERFKGVAPDITMEEAINCIKQAREAFK